VTDRIYWGVGILARFVNRTIPSSHPAMSKSQRATWADTMSAPGSSSRSIAPRARCWEPGGREIAVHEYHDALRALAEVPILAAALVGVGPRAHQGHGG
jgi:hypothetical protein